MASFSEKQVTHFVGYDVAQHDRARGSPHAAQLLDSVVKDA
jgi:hypothetical protein